MRHRCRTLFTGQSRRIDVYTCRAFAIAPKCSSHLGFGLGLLGVFETGSASDLPGPEGQMMVSPLMAASVRDRSSVVKAIIA